MFVRAIGLVVLLTLVGCAEFSVSTDALTKRSDEADRYRDKLKASAALLDKTAGECESYGQNEVLAVKKCFPMVNNKDIFISVEEVDSDGTIRGKTSDRNQTVSCEPSAATLKKIVAKPEMYEGIMKVNGKLKNLETYYYGSSGPFYTFEFENCSVQKFDAKTKLAE